MEAKQLLYHSGTSLAFSIVLILRWGLGKLPRQGSMHKLSLLNSERRTKNFHAHLWRIFLSKTSHLFNRRRDEKNRRDGMKEKRSWDLEAFSQCLTYWAHYLNVRIIFWLPRRNGRKTWWFSDSQLVFSWPWHSTTLDLTDTRFLFLSNWVKWLWTWVIISSQDSWWEPWSAFHAVTDITVTFWGALLSSPTGVQRKRRGVEEN